MSNVILDPLECSELIAQAKVKYFALARLDALRESKRADTVVDAHEDNWRALQRSDQCLYEK